MACDPFLKLGNGIRLLLVSQDAADRARLRHGLEHRFAIVEATTAEEALQWLNARYFSVLLTDYELGDRTGVWLLEEVAKQRPDVHRFLMSGRSVPDIWRLKAEEIFRVLLPKPVDPAVFSQYINSQYERNEEPPRT